MQISKFRLTLAGVITAASFSLAGAGVAYAVQPHMVSARDHLKQGLSELQIADPFDSGGHREQAIEMVRLAIDEVDQGIDYAELHQ
ncbi:hypothetical protein [Mycobacterium sp.]|uniref:hypothetical protein n=1 Tax=Mycobacterium sp. TaxID=1785 RepID=UPI0031D3C06B